MGTPAASFIAAVRSRNATAARRDASVEALPRLASTSKLFRACSNTSTIVFLVLSFIVVSGCGDNAYLARLHASVKADRGSPRTDSLVLAFADRPVRLRTRQDSVRAMTLLLYAASLRYDTDTTLAALTFAGAAPMLYLVPPPADLDQWRRYAETLSEAGMFVDAERTFRSVYGRNLVEAPALLDTLAGSYRVHADRLAQAPDSVRQAVERAVRASGRAAAPLPPGLLLLAAALALTPAAFWAGWALFRRSRSGGQSHGPAGRSRPAVYGLLPRNGYDPPSPPAPPR